VYGKLFSSIYDGTLYGYWEAIVTFQQMIVLADADGIVDMTPQAICARTSMPIDILEKGLKKLSEPDPHSRTPGEDGRRIVCIDEHRPWGWQIVNYLKYKNLRDSDEVREQNRVRAQRFRDKRNGSNGASRGVTASNAESRHTDTDIDIEKRGARATRLPTDWAPSEPLFAWASKERPDLDIATTIAKFRDYWQAKPGRGGTKLDWDATFRNWVRDEKPGRHVTPAAVERI
jgi:hypothetical protein